MSTLRLLAEEAGVEYRTLREHLVREVDERVRGRERAVTERDVVLFESDPGFGGRGPQSMAARASERLHERGAS